MTQSPIIVTTTNDIAGANISAYLGVVRGLIVRTPNIGASILGGLKSLLGGNISQFAKVCEAARQQAFELMVQHAQELGADAIIGMRYDATEFAQGATEVLAYGTAVKLAR
ncbi:MAG: YbjQ family protein [Verrucomicrobiaceae bacterium]